LVLFVLLSACTDSLFVSVDKKIFKSDYKSGEDRVTSADLPSFSGEAISAADFNTLLNSFFSGSGVLYSSVESAMGNSLNGMTTVIGEDHSSRSVDVYSAYAVAVSDEVISIPGCSIHIESLNLAASGYNNYGKTIISDWLGLYFSSSTSPRRTNTLYSTGKSKFDFDTKSKVTINSGSSVLTGIWHHGNKLYTEITDGSFTIDTETGAYSGDGTMRIKSSFNSSLGITLSGIDSSVNGKFIFDITTKDIDVKDVSISSMINDAKIAVENASYFDTIISKYLYKNGKDYFVLTISAFDNGNSIIATKTYQGSDLLRLFDIL